MPLQNTLEHMAESNPAIKYLLKKLKEKEFEINSYKQAMDLKIAVVASLQCSYDTGILLSMSKKN